MSGTQYVHYNGCSSSTKSIEYRVPQGSILGPLFFISIYEWLFQGISITSSILFADDTSVFLIGKEYTQLIVLLNKELKKVSCWFNANGLTINVIKTHFMVFHRARIKAKYLNVPRHGNIIDCVTATIYLRGIIDNKLKWTSHVLYIKNKISKTIGLFYKMRPYLERKAFIKLYYSLVFPYQIYCNEVWGNASGVILNPIIKIQKRAIRTITFFNYLSPSEPIFQSLNILIFWKLVIQRISLLVLKYQNVMFPNPYMIYLKLIIHIIIIRQWGVSLFPIQLVGPKLYIKLLVILVLIWNHISNNISTNVSYSSFKHLGNFYIQIIVM